MVGFTFSEVAWLLFMLSLEDVTGLYTCLLNAAHRNVRAPRLLHLRGLGMTNSLLTQDLLTAMAMFQGVQTRGASGPHCTDIT